MQKTTDPKSKLEHCAGEWFDSKMVKAHLKGAAKEVAQTIFREKEHALAETVVQLRAEDLRKAEQQSNALDRITTARPADEEAHHG